MDATFAGNGKRYGLQESDVRDAKTDDRLRDLLVDLIASSKAWTQESGSTEYTPTSMTNRSVENG